MFTYSIITYRTINVNKRFVPYIVIVLYDEGVVLKTYLKKSLSNSKYFLKRVVLVIEADFSEEENGSKTN